MPSITTTWTSVYLNVKPSQILMQLEMITTANILSVGTQFFCRQMPFVFPNQQCQITEKLKKKIKNQ